LSSGGYPKRIAAGSPTKRKRDVEIELWRRNASFAAKITAGKLPARGCCDSFVFNVELAFMPALLKTKHDKQPST
jgi:hypothetical protein